MVQGKHIMKKMVLFFIFCSTVILYGSDTKTVEYYKTHTVERKAKIKECENNPGELSGTPNCINAHAAQKQSFKLPDLNRKVNTSQMDKF